MAESYVLGATPAAPHAVEFIFHRKSNPILAAASYAYNPSRQKQWSYEICR
jgi:hypothetical protein